jgi:hypothetical protein
MLWSVRRSWITANPFFPSFCRTKKRIRLKPPGFGLSDLLDSLFPSCLKIIFKVNSLFSLLFHYEDLDLVQAWHRAGIWLSESISRSERRKISRTEWWLIAGLHQSRIVHRNIIYVPWSQREIVWSEDVHVTRERACRPAAISRSRVCCSLIVFSE